ncbi:UDP-N-acetylmuramate dehydrogenase [Flavobacteriaceae bacterium GF1]
MEIKDNISLKPYNTFGIDVMAKHFVEVTGLAQLQKLLQLSAYPDKFIISGGSNMLLTKDIEALVMHINLKGIRIVEEDQETVTIKIMAGENWHDLVLWTLDHDYGGLENLSLIPGNTGTAPIQNIGAYGVELKDVFVGCEAMNVQNQELEAFSKEDCQFGYRDSIFKNKAKGEYIITSVMLKLTKANHKLHTFYGAIEDELKQMNVVTPTIRDISNAVVSIRSKKLPDPKEIGNSGSFFKNPVVSRKTFEKLQKKNPNAPFYKMEDDNYKIPAGWLIEQCGFKGKRFGDAGVHKKQALVLVNYGNAKGMEILELAEKIQKTVATKFGIRLFPEVNIIK